MIHSSFTKNEDADFRFNIGIIADAEINVWVSIRPGCERFLETVANLYEVVLFTASTKYYADIVVNEIDKKRSIKYRLYRESCSNIGGCRVKNLSLIGRDLKRTIIIDNSNVAYLLHPYNAIAITSWYDDRKESELDKILNTLTKCYKISRVYEILSDL